MGWTHCAFASNYKYVRKGWKTYRVVDRQKECDHRLTWERKEAEVFDGRVYPPMKDTVLKSAMVGSVYYAAVRREVKGKEPYVWAAVFLTCGKTKWDNTEWGYKDMSEDCMPYCFDCPASILALLTPTDSASANKWREECRKRIAEKAAKRKAGPQPLYAPKGVEVEEQRGSWVLTSENYRRHSSYTAIRFTKARWHEFDRVMRAFLENYGTKEERAEFAASGRECPAEWKEVAA